jgi:hypothetical protein
MLRLFSRTQALWLRTGRSPCPGVSVVRGHVVLSLGTSPVVARTFAAEWSPGKGKLFQSVTSFIANLLYYERAEAQFSEIRRLIYESGFWSHTWVNPRILKHLWLDS